MDAEFVAPARYPLTVLHRQDPDERPGVAADGDPIRGWTVCGLPMCQSEIWVQVAFRESDRICPVCEMKAAASMRRCPRDRNADSNRRGGPRRTGADKGARDQR